MRNTNVECSDTSLEKKRKQCYCEHQIQDNGTTKRGSPSNLSFTYVITNHLNSIQICSLSQSKNLNSNPRWSLDKSMVYPNVKPIRHMCRLKNTTVRFEFRSYVTFILVYRQKVHKITKSYKNIANITSLR